MAAVKESVEEQQKYLEKNVRHEKFQKQELYILQYSRSDWRPSGIYLLRKVNNLFLDFGSEFS